MYKIIMFMLKMKFDEHKNQNQPKLFLDNIEYLAAMVLAK